MPTRKAMAAIAPDLEPELLEAAMAIVEPLEEALTAEIARLDMDETPPFVFDPVRAMGRSATPHALPGAPATTGRNVPVPADATALAYLPMADLAALIALGEVTAIDAVEAYAARIDALNPGLNAYILPTLDQARRQAGLVRTGRLAGVPFAIKDIVQTAGVRTTGGSRLLADHVPARDSAVWARLKGEGALLLGKTNTQEFAAGPTGENEPFGAAHNPWQAAHMTGGSSSGSAAAVAAAMASAAIGTDTGGSIRIPAALCGVVGLKPTYGRVDATGVYPLSWSLDHVGPITRTVRDAGLLLDILAPAPDGSAEAAAMAGAAGDLKGWRLGVPAAAWCGAALQDGVRGAFHAALAVLRELGAEVREVMPAGSAPLLMAVNRALAVPEGGAWHDRFVRAGRLGEYGSNVRARKAAGRLVLATEYLQAQRVRAVLCREFGPVWDQIDALVLPSTPITAPRIGDRTAAVAGGAEVAVVAALLSLVGPFNVLGAPALSVPCGLDGQGLPVGLQIVTAPGADRQALYVGAAFECAAGWALLRPPLAV